jgi:hypothetical protein
MPHRGGDLIRCGTLRAVAAYQRVRVQRTQCPGTVIGNQTVLVEGSMKYGLLWLVGVPIPVLVVLYLLFH